MTLFVQKQKFVIVSEVWAPIHFLKFFASLQAHIPIIILNRRKPQKKGVGYSTKES